MGFGSTGIPGVCGWGARHPGFCSRSWTGRPNRPVQMPPEVVKIIDFCSTYKQKHYYLLIFTYLAGFGKVLENDHRSPFVNIEFRLGRRAKI